jgi:hypothetical protein
LQVVVVVDLWMGGQPIILMHLVQQMVMTAAILEAADRMVVVVVQEVVPALVQLGVMDVLMVLITVPTGVLEVEVVLLLQDQIVVF